MTNMTGCTTQTSSNNNSQPTQRSQVSIEKIPSTLKIVFMGSTNDAQRQERQETLAEYLKKTLKQPVSIEGTKDYNTAVDLLVEEKVQVAILGPLTYLQAKERNPKIEPIVAPISKTTGRPWYKSVIVVNSASGIKTLDDLKGKRLGLVNKQSTSGYMFPVVHLLDIGFNLDRDFASVEFFQSHDKTLVALLDGKVDAVAIESKFYEQAKESGTINDSYPVIWQSEPIPELPVVVSQKLSPQLIIELKEAFISAPIGMLSLEGIPSNGYTLVQDSDYDGVRQVKKQLDEKLGNKQ
ncbi:phosphate/phosphite/phosphonate ABC transporter substrate-binding protein [Microcoleus sp. S13_C5]